MENITGNVTVHIVAFQKGDPRYQFASGKGDKGLSIAQLRKRFGGDEGEIPDPYSGQMHPISLKPWADKDPEKTFLHISFRIL
ncbi:hypothetical protein EPA93_22710 [Ktedonosporobacter rubrisoli]|uniref:Uncharacterized protein n=1 Tax=Ktedonosporobacter rubrisoli TaxID=2509675 RepID=A0A4P6JSW5_KTERU|nr:hypothetical protein [Ktedonosporobacter rubrisoli]QBD78647.1 hypothetical protein EPA93_22710 [Ktedonosporobacter rubrisoli]